MRELWGRSGSWTAQKLVADALFMLDSYPKCLAPNIGSCCIGCRPFGLQPNNKSSSNIQKQHTFGAVVGGNCCAATAATHDHTHASSPCPQSSCKCKHQASKLHVPRQEPFGAGSSTFDWSQSCKTVRTMPWCTLQLSNHTSRACLLVSMLVFASTACCKQS